MTNLSPRRVFLMRVVAPGSVLAAGSAQAQTKVDEADEAAVALGYKADTSKADGKKYATHKSHQNCNNCQFWQGTPSDVFADCAMFGRKQIAAGGWCLAYKKLG